MSGDSERNHYELRIVGQGGIRLDPMRNEPGVEFVKGAKLVANGVEKVACLFVFGITTAAEKLRVMGRKGVTVEVDARWEKFDRVGGYLIEDVKDE